MEELQARMSGREFAEWVAFAHLEPWGFDPRAREERADLRLGVLTALVYNRTRGKDDQPKAPMDFVLRYGESAAKALTEKAKAEKLLQKAQFIMAVLGSDNKRK